jgi:hypothetical protein
MNPGQAVFIEVESLVNILARCNDSEKWPTYYVGVVIGRNKFRADWMGIACENNQRKMTIDSLPPDMLRPLSPDCIEIFEDHLDACREFIEHERTRA